MITVGLTFRAGGLDDAFARAQAALAPIGVQVEARFDLVDRLGYGGEDLSGAPAMLGGELGRLGGGSV